MTKDNKNFIFFVIKAFVLMYLIMVCCLNIFMYNYNDNDAPLEEGFAQHMYSGTFFIDINKNNSFASDAEYKLYMRNERGYSFSKVSKDSKIKNVIDSIFPIILVVGLYYIYKNILKKRFRDFFEKKYMLVLFVGGVWLFNNIISMIIEMMKTSDFVDYFVGALANSKYYFHIYRVLAIPFIVICVGLMLRQAYLEKKKDKEINSKIVKYSSICFLIVSFSFLLYRLVIRTSEVINIMVGKNTSIAIPFTVMDNWHSLLVEVPNYFANSLDIYKNYVLFRYLRDLPIFIIIGICIFLFSKILFNISKNVINDSRNIKILNLSIILFAISSIFFNLMGLIEVNMLNNGFNAIFGNVTYTIGFRSLCEPMIFAVLLLAFKIVLKSIDSKKIKAD